LAQQGETTLNLILSNTAFHRRTVDILASDRTLSTAVTTHREYLTNQLTAQEIFTDLLIVTHRGGGIELAKQHIPHFILSALSMPNVAGWDLIESLRVAPTTAHIPVIALAAGFHNHITKMLKPETFVRDVLTMFCTMSGKWRRR
jgi:CheY-like chemotaxis protein